MSVNGRALVADGGHRIDPEAAQSLGVLLDQPIVTVAGRDWTGRDVVAAGAVSARWHRLEDDLSRGLAALREWTPPPDAVTAGVRDLRYARRLISGDEFNAWLRQRGLTMADVSGVVRRRLAREHGPEASPAAAEPDELVRTLPAEAVCTDAVVECALWLVDRILCLEQLAETPAPAAGELAAACEREAGLLAASVGDEPVATRRERMSLMLAADAAYRAVAGEIASPRAIAREVRRRALDWIRFDLVMLSCATEGAAAEIAALLREGTPVETVLALSGADGGRRLLYLEDAPEEIQGRLGGAVAGDVVGPLPGEAAAVWLVRQRWTPDPDDPAIVERAAGRIIDEQMRRRRAGRVRWHDRS